MPIGTIETTIQVIVHPLRFYYLVLIRQSTLGSSFFDAELIE